MNQHRQPVQMQIENTSDLFLKQLYPGQNAPHPQFLRIPKITKPVRNIKRKIDPKSSKRTHWPNEWPGAPRRATSYNPPTSRSMTSTKRQPLDTRPPSQPGQAQSIRLAQRTAHHSRRATRDANTRD
jgi:hypothetical protein